MVIYETNHNINVLKSCRILALYEVSRECVWLKCVINTYEKLVVYHRKKMESTTMYWDNNVLFNWKGDIEIQKINSCEKLTDLFTKSLQKRTFRQWVYNIEFHHLNDVSSHEKKNTGHVMNNIVLNNTWCCTPFPSLCFYLWFFLVRF